MAGTDPKDINLLAEVALMEGDLDKVATYKVALANRH